MSEASEQKVTRQAASNEEEELDSGLDQSSTSSSTSSHQRMTEVFTIFDPTRIGTKRSSIRILQTATTVNESFDSSLSHTLTERLRYARRRYAKLGVGIRLVTIAICFIWFLVNSIIIWDEYVQNDTKIFLEYQTPNTSYPPAITICTHCILCE